MIHRAWGSIEEVPYGFSRSSIKFQGHTGRKIDDLIPIWLRLLGWPQLSNPTDLPCFVPNWSGMRRLIDQGLTLSIWFTCPSGTWFWKFTCPAKFFMCPSQYLYKPCKAYAYCWENKYMPRQKNHLPSRARNQLQLQNSLFDIIKDKYNCITTIHDLFRIQT